MLWWQRLGPVSPPAATAPDRQQLHDGTTIAVRPLAAGFLLFSPLPPQPRSHTPDVRVTMGRAPGDPLRESAFSASISGVSAIRGLVIRSSVRGTRGRDLAQLVGLLAHPLWLIPPMWRVGPPIQSWCLALAVRCGMNNAPNQYRALRWRGAVAHEDAYVLNGGE